MSGSRAANHEGTVTKEKDSQGRTVYRAFVTINGKKVGGPRVRLKKDAKPALWNKIKARANEPAPEDSPFMTLAHSWLKGAKMSASSRTVATSALKAYAPSLGLSRVKEIDETILESARSLLTCSLSTAKRYEREIKKILAIFGRRLKTKPAGRIPDPDIRVLTPEEQRKMIEAASWPRTRLAIELLLDTGVRPGEACGLMHSDRYEDGIWIKRTRGRDGDQATKTDASRAWVPLSPRLAAQIGPPRTGYVLALGNTPWSVINLRRAIIAVASEIGITDLTTNDLRHTAAVNMLAAGVDPATVASITRHSVDTLLKIYYRGSNDLKREALAKTLARLAPPTGTK